MFTGWWLTSDVRCWVRDNIRIGVRVGVTFNVHTDSLYGMSGGLYEAIIGIRDMSGGLYEAIGIRTADIVYSQIKSNQIKNKSYSLPFIRRDLPSVGGWSCRGRRHAQGCRRGLPGGGARSARVRWYQGKVTYNNVGKTRSETSIAIAGQAPKWIFISVTVH